MRQAQPAVLQIEVQFGGAFFVEPVLAPVRDLRRQRAGHVLGQAHGLADIAHRAAAAIADDGGADRGAVAAIGVVDPLDDFLAPFMFEVDVDVGRFAAFGADETFEQQAGARGVDRGDAEHVTNRRIGGRPAALAQDVLRAREPDDRVHGEEIRRVVQLRDQIEFVMQLLRHVVGDAVGIARARRLPRSVVPVFVARSDRRCGPRAGTGSAVRSSENRQRSAISMVRSTAPGWRANSRAISSGGFQVAVGGVVAVVADLVDGAALADAGQHVGEDVPAAARDTAHRRWRRWGCGRRAPVRRSRCRRTASLGRRRNVSAR